MIIFCFLILSCMKDTERKIDSNFNIIIEGETQRIHISANEYVRFYAGDSAKVCLNLSEDEMARIFRAVEENNIFKISSNFSPCGYCGTLPYLKINVTLINGKNTRRFRIANCDYFFLDYYRVKRINNLLDVIYSIVFNKNQVKSLPFSDIYLE